MGLETLFELYKDSAKSRLHEIVICLHSILLERKLKSIGKVYDPNQASSIKGSELLPSGWNDDLTTVELYYIDSAKTNVYKVLALTEGNSCLLHLLTAQPGVEKSAFIELSVDEYVQETSHKTVDQVYKNLDGLKKVVVEELINVIIPPNAEQGASGEPDRNIREPGRPFVGIGSEGPSRQFDPLRDYGRADVDPFYVEPGGLGTSPPGGMIFDPFRAVRPRAPDRFSGLIQPLPRGSVPPGARFDPFGPPGTGMPDPDLERRPNFNDDFYS